MASRRHIPSAHGSKPSNSVRPADLPRLTDEERESLDSGLIAMEGVSARDEPKANPVIAATDLILSGLAILECFTGAVPDERAKDRYLLWAVRDKFEEAYEIVQMLPARTGEGTAQSSSADAQIVSEGEPTLTSIICEIEDAVVTGIGAARDALREYLAAQDDASPTLQLICDALIKHTTTADELCDKAQELLS